MKLRNAASVARAARERSARNRRSGFEVLEARLAPATFLVVNALDGPGTGPAGSLRAAVSQANASGSDNNLVVISSQVRGPIALTAGELSIGTNLSLVNRSGRALEILQTTPGDRVFHVTSNTATAGLNLVAPSDRTALTIAGGNVATGNGGAILVENSASVLRLSHVRLIGNSAGLASQENSAQSGGGIYTTGSVVLDHSTVAANQTSGDGGGVWAGAGVVMTSSSVAVNRAGADGGGLFIASGGSSFSRSDVVSNQAKNVGGINEVKGNVQVSDRSRINQNSSTAVVNPTLGDFGGGGIYVGVGNVSVSRSQVSDNHSVGMYSAGIVVGLGSVMVTAGSQINGNVNNGPGGGIAANFGGIVTVSGRSQVNGNTGSAIGGGIVNFAGRNGGVRILGGSQVSHNTLTNGETLGQAIAVFLEFFANRLGIDFASGTGVASPAALQANIAQLEQDVASTDQSGASLSDPPGFLVAGGGIGTLNGAPTIIAGNSRVSDNQSGVRVSGGSPVSIGIGGGLFAALGPISIQGSSVDSNTSMGSGGGVWNGSALSTVGATIASNTAILSLGGGLFNSRRGTASLLQTTVQANRSSVGGGIFNGGTLNLNRSSVVRNHALIRGGGIENPGTLNRSRSVVIGNTPDNIDPPA